MFRTLLGGVLGGFAMFLIGFVFWGTPLSNLAISSTDAQSSADLQAALAKALTPTGSGVYVIPDFSSAEGTVLYGKGPIAMVHFNVSGFPAVDGSALIAGLILAVAVSILIAFALRAVAQDFTARATVLVLFSLVAVLWIDVGQPIFNHAPWGYFVYLAFSDFIALVAAGLIAARWFMPKDEVKAEVASPPQL
jgi:hypothetical protein